MRKLGEEEQDAELQFVIIIRVLTCISSIYSSRLLFNHRLPLRRLGDHEPPDDFNLPMPRGEQLLELKKPQSPGYASLRF